MRSSSFLSAADRDDTQRLAFWQSWKLAGINIGASNLKAPCAMHEVKQHPVLALELGGLCQYIAMQAILHYKDVQK